MNRVYAYLRASTADQDALRAKGQLVDFAKKHNLKISAYFIENESGATLKRPELFRLLDVAEESDVLLVEQVDRISRLNSKAWSLLKQQILVKGIQVVSLDLPTSHQFIKQNDEFMQRMLQAINAMMLDMLAAISRKDYEDRRKRQAQGVQKAKELGKYKGRPVNLILHSKIKELLLDGKSYTSIQRLLGCSRHTISKVKKTLKLN